MAQKRNIVVATPRGCVYTITTPNGSVTTRLKWAQDFVPKKKAAFMRGQEFVDSECLRYMKPMTPRLTGAMVKSATLGTVIGSGSIEYLVPYARRQYYEHKKKARWFERMKATRKEPILKGAMRIVSS